MYPVYKEKNSLFLTLYQINSWSSYAAYGSGLLPTFRDNLSAQSSRLLDIWIWGRWLSRNVGIKIPTHVTYIQKQRMSQLHCSGILNLADVDYSCLSGGHCYYSARLFRSMCQASAFRCRSAAHNIVVKPTKYLWWIQMDLEWKFFRTTISKFKTRTQYKEACR
jgi:hypothetical protein